jgi:hypothetical protein
MMARYIRKAAWVEARQFTTNNEPDDKEMDSLILWLGSNGTKATHDGTSIFIKMPNGQIAEAVVGDWIVIDHKWRALLLVSKLCFAETFEECTHDWEAIADSDEDQCLFCEEVRTCTPQYFGDEVL